MWRSRRPPVPEQQMTAFRDATLTIPQSCVRTGQSYNQIMRRVFRGELPAYQDKRGRWWLSAVHVERLARQLRPELTAHSSVDCTSEESARHSEQ
jgi:hypothetical protein